VDLTRLLNSELVKPCHTTEVLAGKMHSMDRLKTGTPVAGCRNRNRSKVVPTNIWLALQEWRMLSEWTLRDAIHSPASLFFLWCRLALCIWVCDLLTGLLVILPLEVHEQSEHGRDIDHVKDRDSARRAATIHGQESDALQLHQAKLRELRIGD